MEISYWESRWRKNKIGFHAGWITPSLKKYHSQLGSPDTVLVPLCGKSRDMIWLSEQGWRVIGVEAVEKACVDFFTEQKLEYETITQNGITVFRSDSIEIWNANFFHVSPGWFTNQPTAVYDRAALAALPAEKRRQYVDTVSRIASPQTPMMAHVFTYNQNEMNGPPFSVPPEEMEQLFKIDWSLQLLHSEPVLERLEKYQHRGVQQMSEQVWLLTRKH